MVWRGAHLTLLAMVLALGGTAFADAFEFLAFTPPGKPWVKNVQDDGRIIYSRNAAHGVGIILLIPSITPIGTPAEEFQTFWRAHVTPINKAPVPAKPQERAARDLTMVWGATVVDIAGAKTDVQVVMFVGRGSVLGTVTMTSGADAIRDVAAFNASVKVLDANRPIAHKPEKAPAKPPEKPAQPVRPALSPAPVAPVAPAAAADVAVTYQTPPGYTTKKDSSWVWFIPTTVSKETACVYGIGPPRATLGSLEKDAHAALDKLPSGWQRLNRNSTKHRGVASTGWSYYYVSDFTRNTSGNGTAMALALPAPSNKTTIVVGIGAHECQANDNAFAALFHSLVPDGWTSDEGKALRKGLLASWRYTTGTSSTYGMMQYAFYPNGRYQLAYGTSAELGYYEYTYTGLGDGAWSLDGDVLTIVRDKDRSTQRYRVRVFSDWMGTEWRDAIQLYDEKSSNLVYYKVVGEKPKQP